MLHPPDIYILAGLIAEEDDAWTYRQLALDLGVPHPLVQRALQRAEEAGLYSSRDRDVHFPNVEEFLQHGLRFLAPGKLGPVVAGVPAAWAAPPMVKLIHESSEFPPVWPSERGHLRGLALPPLHEAAVQAFVRSPHLAELLSIIDSIRAGDLRVRSVAGKELANRLRMMAHHSVASR